MADELSWVRWVTALFVVAIAMALSIWALRRAQSAGHGWLPIRVTGRVRLNRSAELVLAEVNNERFSIGATPANISTIAQWSAAKAGGEASVPAQSADHATG